MRFSQAWRDGLCAFGIFSILATAVPAAAQTAPPAPTAAPTTPTAPSTSSVLQGTVRGAGGAAIAGARITASGPATVSTTSDASGAFTLTVPPGIYHIEVTHGGYLPANLSDYAVVAGTSVPVNISLSEPNLTSLRSIGSVSSTSRGSGSAINTGAAASSFLSAQAFQNTGNPQINDTLQQLPSVTIQHMGSQQDTTIIAGGVQPYETQVLVDGHPLALGQYGVWVSQYFPSFLIGGVETQTGPGNTTPFANIAVGGTVNLLTPSFTKQTTAEFVTGMDNYSTQFSHMLATGSAGKLEYVVDLGTDGYNGPYYQTSHCDVTAQGSVGIIQQCGDASGSFFSKGTILKAQYDFSPRTSFEAGFIGAWGGYSPQGTAWATTSGPVTIVPCISNPATPGNSATTKCTNPNYSNYIGQQVNSIDWYPGSTIYNNQELFDAQLRTSIGSQDTLLVRPYWGSIEPEVINGSGEAGYPVLFSPANPTSDQTAAFEAACSNAYGSTVGPNGQPTVVNGQTQCYDSPYSTFEKDQLYGTTFSYLHPIGESLLNLTYDFHGESTYAYVGSPNPPSVPFSTDRYSTISLTGDLHFIKNVGVGVGLYDTRYTVVGVQRADPNSLTDTSLTGLSRTITRFDPHLALTFRPHSDLSYRASWGTSTTFPYIGQVSGLATYEQPAQSLGPYALGGTLTEKNPSLEPEQSIAYGVGVDKRFANGSVLSFDLQDSVIHDVFEPLTQSVAVPGGLEGIFYPINAARLDTQIATLQYRHAPLVGFGYNISAAGERSMVEGLPPSVYSSGSQSFPVNNVQICGNGIAGPGIPTCIPYLKGYGQLTYTWNDGTYTALGVDYEGKNNAYFQPPFALVDFTLRRPIRKGLDFEMGVQNLLNTNNYGTYLSTVNAGTPIVAGSVDANGNEIQQSFTPIRISAPPRIVRVQLRLHTGR
ncbi:MAG TPA: TonB-dependent receptor [Candidatus Limnocylindria bacterium]|nr:TonB-dependent receptor [Candidatus Limnocylindria bacterium]